MNLDDTAIQIATSHILVQNAQIFYHWDFEKHLNRLLKNYLTDNIDKRCLKKQRNQVHL